MADTGRRDTNGGNSRWLTGLVLALLFVFSLLSLLTYDWRDIAWLQSPPNEPLLNMSGPVGAWAVFFGYHLFGLSLWLAPIWFGIAATLLLLGRTGSFWRRTAWAVGFLLALCSLLQLGDHLLTDILERLNLAPNAGGALGCWLMTDALERWLSPVGGGLLALAVLLVTGVMAVGPRRIAGGARALAAAWSAWRASRAAAAEAAAATREERDRLQYEQAESKAAERGFDGRVKVQDELPARRARETRRTEPEAGSRKPEAGTRKPDGGSPGYDSVAAGQPAVPGAPSASSVRSVRSVRPEPAAPAPAPEAPDRPTVQPVSLGGYHLPGIDLLDPIPSGEAVHGDTEQLSRLLVDTLAQFNLPVEVTHVERGPVVTRYELLPAAGIRVERIAQLAHTLQMVLKANSLRIQAPVPGKNVVGVEVPNPKARTVTLREVLQGNAWTTNKMEIPLALGKDVGGSDIVFDLASAPHLLVAGATGSGKSVCLNAILAGLLMSRRPDELKLLLVDPKRVEFQPYNNLPHLLVPVVTDPKKVSFALRWAIVEMDRRYKMLQAARVRNIVAFNAREPAQQTELPLEGLAGVAPGGALPARLPYVVIVIDEVADLMITVGPEIEMSITRLAQLSRAVGIHMVLATQRPSVNVITGTIKANFPGRIAFQVAQKTDSRTILDQQGAESLIGRGDMLFLNPKNGRLIRSQGALVNDGEIGRLVECIKGQVGPDFDQALSAKLEKVQDSGPEDEEEGGTSSGASAGGAAPNGDDAADEELIQQSIQVIRDTRRASTSSLQRRLRIGYTRAARVMDILEERGFVGPTRGAEPREILIDLDAEMPNNNGAGAAADVPTEEPKEQA